MLPVGSITETGDDVLPGQVGEIVENFLLRHTGRQVRKHIIDSDSHASNAGPSSALARLDSDNVLVAHTGILTRRRD